MQSAHKGTWASTELSGKTNHPVGADTLSPDGIRAGLEEPQDFIAKQKTDITEFDDALAGKLIDIIAVLEELFSVEFKSGLTIEIEA